MQISAQTLLASQQQAGAIQPRPAPGFAAALEKAAGFEPLALKQIALAQDPVSAQSATGAPAKLGGVIDIRV